VTGFAAASSATLIYGSLKVANQLILEKHSLSLPKWPKHLAGYRIGLLADLHLRDKYSVELCQRAVDMALAEAPDIYIIPGDFVSWWKPESAWLLEEVLAPFREMGDRCIGVPGNHDYWSGDPSILKPILNELGIDLLRNEVLSRDGITWAGIDSANALAADPFTTMLSAQGSQPIVALWHEPDPVDFLPEGAALMLSGHSHGGQFRFPWGWTPMHTRNGEKYVHGFFPDAPTPLYVSRGIGTTGPPSRLGALPEVSVLTLESQPH
jgi:predicted MPP superfamily phosphohydrolase